MVIRLCFSHVSIFLISTFVLLLYLCIALQIRKLDDSEFRNAFSRSYIRVGGSYIWLHSTFNFVLLFLMYISDWSRWENTIAVTLEVLVVIQGGAILEVSAVALMSHEVEAVAHISHKVEAAAEVIVIVTGAEGSVWLHWSMNWYVFFGSFM